MSQQPRITLHIDHILSDRPGLDRAALERALRQEIARLLATPGGIERFTDHDRSQVRTDLPAGRGDLNTRVATATVKALNPGAATN